MESSPRVPIAFSASHFYASQAPYPYPERLSAGGSDAPHVLLGKLGVDVNDPAFWELGLRLLDGMVSEAEELAHAVGSQR
ncbi:MAG TPA: hypothetical protein VN688_20010 [Gemmataceae bacterium]|nr:hypothetical protein [Gemmataceae bacterium]